MRWEPGDSSSRGTAQSDFCFNRIPLAAGGKESNKETLQQTRQEEVMAQPRVVAREVVRRGWGQDVL